MTPFATVLAALALAAAGAGGGDPSDIEKFHRVDARVCTGAQPTTSQVFALKDAGVRTIVNLREPEEHEAGAERDAALEAGLRYIHIPVRASEPSASQADAFLAALEDEEVYPVFIHCGSGNRVGAFWMIRRMLVDGWSAEDAQEEARDIGLKSQNLRDFALTYVGARVKKGSEAGRQGH